MRTAAAEFVDLKSYAIDQIASSSYKTILERVRVDLRAVGCAVIPGFVHEDRVDSLIEEADRVAAHAHNSFNRTNAYFTTDDETLPESHPIRRFYDRSNAFVPADRRTKISQRSVAAFL